MHNKPNELLQENWKPNKLQLKDAAIRRKLWKDKMMKWWNDEKGEMMTRWNDEMMKWWNDEKGVMMNDDMMKLWKRWNDEMIRKVNDEMMTWWNYERMKIQ